MFFNRRLTWIDVDDPFGRGGRQPAAVSEPVLPGQPRPALGGDLFELSRDGLEFGEDHGWIERPGMALMFWRRRWPGVYVVLTPDIGAVEAAVHGWLEERVLEVEEPLVVAEPLVVLNGVGGSVLGFVATGDHHYEGGVGYWHKPRA